MKLPQLIKQFPDYLWTEDDKVFRATKEDHYVAFLKTDNPLKGFVKAQITHGLEKLDEKTRSHTTV